MRLSFLLTVGLFLASVSGIFSQTRADVPVPFSTDELQRRTFLYFWETADTVLAQVPDRYPTLTFSSIAATGFGLSSYIVGAERGWITRAQAAERVLKTLTALKNLPQGPAMEGVSGYKGFFYHFLDLKNARRFGDVELSTIDSGLLLAGILSCQTWFDGNSTTEKAIRDAADFLYRRVEWDWMLNANNRLSMGWRPERGFIPSEWYGYNEAMILYILALGSPTHSIPERSWTEWTRPYYWDEYQGQSHVNFFPLFGHQYSHVWIDFKGIQDPYMKSRGIDYFENSRRATLANRAYCLENPKKFKGYGPNVWGLTACDGPMDWAYRNDPRKTCAEIWNDEYRGYSARGAASDVQFDDGTLAPTAAGGSVPFAPEVCLPALQAMWETYYDSLVGRYGFKDCFNPSFTACGRLPKGWFDVDYLGIDQGPILLMLENHRSGLLWNIMKRNPYIVRGLQRAGFEGGWLSQSTVKPGFADRLSVTLPEVNPDVPTDPSARFERYRFRPDPKAPGLPYRFLRPMGVENPGAGEQYPLVIFLHGPGERGVDNEAQLKNGVFGFIEGNRSRRFPCYILAPQCPPDSDWVDRDRSNGTFSGKLTEPMRDLIAMIDQMLAANPSIDRRRVYLTGLSMGGFGTFDLLARRPELFAAALPLSGGGDLGAVSKYKDVPLWIFHGTNDFSVPVDFSRNLVKALQQAGAKPKYTEYNTLGHLMGQETYYDDDVIEWLFMQRK
jgi:predicted esterase